MRHPDSDATAAKEEKFSTDVPFESNCWYTIHTSPTALPGAGRKSKKRAMSRLRSCNVTASNPGIIVGDLRARVGGSLEISCRDREIAKCPEPSRGG